AQAERQRADAAGDAPLSGALLGDRDLEPAHDGRGGLDAGQVGIALEHPLGVGGADGEAVVAHREAGGGHGWKLRSRSRSLEMPRLSWARTVPSGRPVAD